MRRGFRFAIALAVFLSPGAIFSRADDEDIEKPEYGVPHPECTLFTERRQQILRGDIELENAGGLSALTDQVVSALPGGSNPSRSRSGALRDTAYDNYIDTHVFTTLKRLGIPPADPASDQEFLRRVTDRKSVV